VADRLWSCPSLSNANVVLNAHLVEADP